jgi:EAL domain-containing protein (putative c-di-GMP-specific phosphodiesterase class I)/GGDEF domain-containing protein
MNSANYPLLIDLAVNLTVGWALLWLWWRNREHAFARDMGWALLCVLPLMAAPLMYAALELTVGRAAPGLLVLSGMGYAWWMLGGLARLAGREPGRLARLCLWAALVAACAWVARRNEAYAVQAALACLNLGLGAVALVWPAGGRVRGRGLLAVLLGGLGGAQFAVMASGNALQPLQASLSILLHMGLALALVYRALERENLAVKQGLHRLEQLTDGSRQGIFILDHKRVLYANQAALTLLRVRTALDIAPDALMARLASGSGQAHGELLARVVQGQQDEASFAGEVSLPGGSWMRLHLHAFRTDWEGQPATQLLVSHDAPDAISQAEQARPLLPALALAVSSRELLLRRLLARCEELEEASSFVLILLEVDRAKFLVDANGAASGEDLVEALACTLTQNGGHGHQLMRLAEDEFALLSAPGDAVRSAASFAASVRRLLNKPIAVGARRYMLDVSLGIALYPHSASDAHTLLDSASSALHVAKRTPGLSYFFAEGRMPTVPIGLIEQERQMRAGMHNGEFHLVYQPKVDARTSELKGFEALARWSRPGHASTSPAEFIATAEQTGLIGALGNHLLSEACLQMAFWEAELHACVPVSVNVSAWQLLDPGFPHLVERMLANASVPPHMLTLEIAESSALGSLAQTAAQIDRLRELGVGVTVDDFGNSVPFAAFEQALPLRAVKIDHALVEDLPSVPALAAVRAICEWARTAKLTVIGAGVETPEQAVSAREAGCNELQGYYYARPLSPVDAGRWMQRVQPI